MQKRILFGFLALCLIVASLPVTMSAAEAEIYVSASGSDATGNGTLGNPYASLSKAAGEAAGSATIYVMSDLETTACARYYNKDLTITSYGAGIPHTITRGAVFSAQLEPAREWYNPAIIEVGAGSSLRLENIILDDAGKFMGTIYAAAPQGEFDDKSHNQDYVQDAMIASYDGAAIITMGNGAVLRNYGGMSAVRLCGAKLVMESGSLIEDTFDLSPKNRGKGSVWLQGGELAMEQGATIQNLNSNAQAINGEGGTITINGEITGLSSNGRVAQMGHNTQLTVGRTGNLHHNQVYYGTIYAQGSNCNIHVYGKIVDNYSTDRAGGVCLANNMVGATCTMYDGAEIKRNVSASTGGGVMVSCGTFTMLGGEISDNIAGVGAVVDADRVGGGVYVRRGGSFIMEGGTVSNNSSLTFGGGIAYDASDFLGLTPYVDLNGGTITGNMMNVTVSGGIGSYSASGGVSNDLALSSTAYGKTDRYLRVTDDVTLGDHSIYMDNDRKTITPNSASFGLKLGNVSTESITALNTASQGNGWDNATGTFWEQSDRAVVLDVGELTLDASLPVYSIIQATDADGKPAIGTTCAFYATTVDNGNITVAVPAFPNGCAVALVQPLTDYGSMTVTGPVSILEQLDAINYSVPYTAVYSMSQTLASIIETEQASIDDLNCTFQFTLQMDPRLAVSNDTEDYDFTSPIFELDDVAASGNDLIVTYKLKDDWQNYILDLTTEPMTLTSTAILSDGDFDAGDFLCSTENIQMNILLLPVFVPADCALTKMVGLNDYTITFDPNGGTLAIGTTSPVTVKEGETVSKPNNPFRSGYTFGGWTLNGASYDFSRPVTQSFTLVARWNNNNGGSSGGNDNPTRYTITVKAREGGSISPSGDLNVVAGNSQTFITEPDPGYIIADVLVDGKSAGAVSSYTFKDIQQNHSIEVIFEEIPMAAYSADTGVSSLLETDEHIAYLKGYPNGTFAPARNMTRAEAAQMFYNLLLDNNVNITVTFTDVPADAWYAQAINTLASIGIVVGIGENRYAPDREITRAEFTVIAMRFARLDTSGENIFNDVGKNNWFYDYVIGAIKYGWINGYEDGTFRPDNAIIRAEVVAIVNHMLGRSADVDYVAGHMDTLRQFPDVTDNHWAYYEIIEATNAHNYMKIGGNEEWLPFKR